QPFRVLPGTPKRGDADLLIQKGLLDRWRWRGGKSLLNLKDLLPVLPSSLKRVFENGAHFETPLFVQNRTKFRHFLSKRGRIWHKIDVFRDRFYCNGPRPYGCEAIPMSGDLKLVGRPKASPERHTTTCRQAVTESHERVAGWLPIW